MSSKSLLYKVTGPGYFGGGGGAQNSGHYMMVQTDGKSFKEAWRFSRGEINGLEAAMRRIPIPRLSRAR